MALLLLMTLSTASGIDDAGDSLLIDSKEQKVQRISEYVEYVHNGTYAGDPRRNDRGVPRWTQRTSILYFKKRTIGDPLIWMVLALGTLANGRSLISDKKRSVQLWREENSYLYSKLEEYLPRMWSDPESFARDMEEDKIYVYKPAHAFQGTGIRFERGSDLLTFVTGMEEGSRPATKWIIQDFVNPFLHDGRKTHHRVLTLLIVQPNQARDFYQFRVIKTFAAAEPFDEERLLHDKNAAASMLLTNLHQSRAWFQEHFVDEKYNQSRYIIDAKESFERSDSGVSFEHVYDEIKRIHTYLYSIIGPLFTCKGTDVSVYDDACFYIVASDIAVDNTGKPYFLEANRDMGMTSWTKSEIKAFADGAAALIQAPEAPFKVEKSPLWDKIDLVV